MTDPTPYWTRGDQYTASEHVALWTVEHAPYDVARMKGRRVGTLTYGAYVYRDGDVLRMKVTPRPGPAFTGTPAPPHALDGAVVDSMEAAERVLFDAGIWAFMEVLTKGSLPKRGPDYEPDPEEVAFEREHAPFDQSGWVADAAAADMVYGKGP